MIQASIVRLDALIQSLDAEAKAIVSDEVSDSLRPDLTLSGSYATNALEATQNKAAAKIDDQDRPTTQVGVNFSMPLDFGLVSEARRAARLDAEASRYRALRANEDAKLGWEQLTREFTELNKKIEIAKRISDLQKSKSDNERVRLERGRTTTFQVVNFEEDADDATLSYLQLKVNREKMALQSYIFARAEVAL